MKKLAISMAVIVVVGLLGLGLKTYTVVVGDVATARLRTFVVTMRPGLIRGDCYWDLMQSNGVVVAENVKSDGIVKSVAGVYPTFVQIRNFVTNEFADYIVGEKTRFADSQGN